LLVNDDRQISGQNLPRILACCETILGNQKQIAAEGVDSARARLSNLKQMFTGSISRFPLAVIKDSPVTQDLLRCSLLPQRLF
jgi:hypothetical protein